MLWSDKMTFDKAGRQTGHPVTMSLGEDKLHTAVLGCPPDSLDPVWLARVRSLVSLVCLGGFLFIDEGFSTVLARPRRPRAGFWRSAITRRAPGEA